MPQRWAMVRHPDAVGMCNAMGSGIDVTVRAGTLPATMSESPGVVLCQAVGGWSSVPKSIPTSALPAGCSLVVDRLGRPHILYGTQRPLVGPPECAVNLDEEGKWVHELVDDDGDCGEINAVTIDADGFCTWPIMRATAHAWCDPLACDAGRARRRYPVISIAMDGQRI